MYVKNLVKSILVISLIAVIMIYSAEHLLRLFGLGNPIIYKTNLTYRYYPESNQKNQRQRNSIVSINDNHLRAVNNWSTPADHRILFFGDSITYGGSYIDDHQLFSELVCVNLTKQTSKKYLCGNAGVNAYGVDNIANRIEFDNIDNEDWIIVTLIGADVFRSLQNISALPFFLQQPRHFPALQELAIHSAYNSLNFFRGSNAENIDDTKVALRSLYRLRDVLNAEAEKGKQVLLVVSPEKNELLTHKLGEGYKLIQQVFGDSNNRSFKMEMLNHLHKDRADAYYYDSAHLEVDGHKIYADAISELILKAKEKHVSVK